MNENEELCLVTMRVRGPAGRHMVPGSVRLNCSRCGEEVWVSPASLKLLETHTMDIVCMECVPIEELEASEIEMPTEQQKEEILHAGARLPIDDGDIKRLIRKEKLRRFTRGLGDEQTRVKGDLWIDTWRSTM